MSEMPEEITEYLPEICPDAKREDNHFNCSTSCTRYKQKEQYICPCFGKDGSGWISVSDEKIEELKSEVRRWNECRKQILLKDNYSLKGYDGFHVSQKEILIEQFNVEDIEERKRQIIELLDNGDKIGFNEDYGVGRIGKGKDGFTVIEWYYRMESRPVENGTIDDVIRFLFDFWGNSEPFSYTKAGYPELET